jgi:hypothetical protein
VREIEFLRSLEDTTGVLPILDAHLPDAPSRNDRPWLAMPIATPIDDALGSSGLDIVVGAMAQIARTLSRLRAENGVAHRDLKPGNLYELRGNWLVGDFGLIAVPDIGELTRTASRSDPPTTPRTR